MKRIRLPKLPDVRKWDSDTWYVAGLFIFTGLMIVVLLGQWGFVPKFVNSAAPFTITNCPPARPYFGSINCVENTDSSMFTVGADEVFEGCASCNRHKIQGRNINLNSPSASCGYAPLCGNAIYLVSNTGSWRLVCNTDPSKSWAQVQTACTNNLAAMTFTENVAYHFEVWAYNSYIYMTSPPANPSGLSPSLVGKSASVSGITFTLNAFGEHFVSHIDAGYNMVPGTEGCTNTKLLNAYLEGTTKTVRQNEPLSLDDVANTLTAAANGALQAITEGSVPLSSKPNVLQAPVDAVPDEGYWVFYKWENIPAINFGTYQGSTVYCDSTNQLNKRLLTTTEIETSGGCYTIPFSQIQGFTPQCCNQGDCIALGYGAGYKCDPLTYTCKQGATACPLGDYQCGEKSCFRQGTNTFSLSGSFCVSGQCTDMQKAVECCVASDCGNSLAYDCVYDENADINKCTPRKAPCPADMCCKSGGTYQETTCADRGYSGTTCCTTTNAYMAPLSQCKATCEEQIECAWWDLPCQIKKIIADFMAGALATVKMIVAILAFLISAGIAWNFAGTQIKDPNMRMLATVTASLIVAVICYSII